MTLREARMTKYTRQIIISYYSATRKYNPYINGNPNDVLNLKNYFDSTAGNHWVFIIGDPNVHYFPAGCPMNLSRFSSYSVAMWVVQAHRGDGWAAWGLQGLDLIPQRSGVGAMPGCTRAGLPRVARRGSGVKRMSDEGDKPGKWKEKHE